MAIMSKSACQVTCHSLSYCFEIEHGSILHIGNIGSFTMQFISREACEISHMLQVHFSFFTMPKAMKAMKVMKAAKKAAAPAPTKKAMKAISLSHRFRPIACYSKLFVQPIAFYVKLFLSVLLLWQQYISFVHTCFVLL